MKKLLLAAAASMALASSANAATIITEGFESGFGVFSPSGQVQIATGADYQPCCFTTGNTTNHFVAFGSGNLPSGSIMSTVFDTLVGETYTLDFDYAALGSGSESLFLTVGGQTFTVSPVANNNLDTTFTGATFTFLGTGAGTTLDIMSSGVNNVDAIIDNISVTGPIPEPATWAMMIGGFGLVGGAMRRARRSRSALAAA